MLRERLRLGNIGHPVSLLFETAPTGEAMPYAWTTWEAGTKGMSKASATAA
jgi:hypothetical protein